MTDELLEAWLRCERRAWLERHRPELRSPEAGLAQYLHEQRADLRGAYRALFVAANALPERARDLADNGTPDAAATVRDGPGFLPDASFELAEGGAAALTGMPLRGHVDGARRLPGGWALDVIAAGTRARPHHIRRLAFGRSLAEANGWLVHSSLVVHVARDRDPKGPPLRLQDVTAAAAEEQRRLPRRLEATAATLRAGAEPRTDVGTHCHRPSPCPFVAHCWSRYGEHSIFQLPGLSRRTRDAFRSAGWSDARHLPRRPPGVTAAERQALADARGRGVRVDLDALRAGLDHLAPPVAYLDMEFATPAVPWVPGTAPFEPLPFQLSLHLEGADGTVTHVGHLHEGPASDPRPAIAAVLMEALTGAGSVVVYDAAAEVSLLAGLAAAVPAAAPTLDRARARTWDLLALVRTAVRHPGFGTGWGLKRVAAALAPGSYADVALADGLAAQATWRRFLRSGDAKLREQLERYCEADSRALLTIVRVLRRWAEAGAPRAGEG